MKKTAILLAIVLAISLTACKGEKTQSVRVVINNEEIQKTIVEVEDLMGYGADEENINFLDEMEGFWSRPEGYTADEDDALFDVTELLVESRTESWTPYYNGVAGQSLHCSADVDGLHLYSVEGEEFVVLTYNGESFIGEGGVILYERTATVEERLALEATE